MKEQTNQPSQAVIAGSNGAEMAWRESERRLAHAMSLAQLADWAYDVASGLFTFSDRYFALHGTTSELEGGDKMSAEAFARKFVHPGDAPLVGQEIAKAVATVDADYFAQVQARILRRDGQVRHVLVRISVTKNAEGRTIRLHGANQDITKSKETELEIQHQAAFARFNPNPVLELSSTGEIAFFNGAAEDIAHALGLRDPAQMLPLDTAEIVRECLAAGAPRIRMETRIGPRVISWSFFPVKLTNAVHCYGSDITEEKRIVRDLLATSRMAGMEEVATSVLHDVGNVLNSVNISGAIVSDKMRQSKIPMLGKTIALLREHEGDLAAFLTVNGKGKQLLDYLGNLADHLMAEQTEMVKELALLTKNIEHIKEIVARQQNYARVSGICEMASPADLVEDALNMNGASLNHHHIELVRQYSNTPAINVDKHKVLQILVNMIRNAKHACDETKRTDKRLTVAVGLADDRRVRISVIDNGIGISAENQPRIFNHGFTTRRDGHGFGLHSGALAAKEMGGCMTMHSDGMGLGATFTLELPLQPPRGAHAKPAGRANLDRAPSPGPNGNGHLVAAGRERPSLTAESRGSLTPNIKCHALLV